MYNKLNNIIFNDTRNQNLNMIIVKITDGTRTKKIFWILHRTIKYNASYTQFVTTYLIVKDKYGKICANSKIVIYNRVIVRVFVNKTNYGKNSNWFLFSCLGII